MAARDVLKNLNAWVDGRGQAGQLQEYNPPKLTLQTEEVRMGGMDTPVDLTMGMEKLVTDFTLIGYDKNVLALFGVVGGAFVPFTVRGALESFDSTTTSVIHTMRGKITELDKGTWTPGQPAPLKVTMSLVYYKEQHGNTIIHEVDVENMVRIVNGVDTLAAIRNALGM